MCVCVCVCMPACVCVCVLVVVQLLRSLFYCHMQPTQDTDITVNIENVEALTGMVCGLLHVQIV